MLSSSCVLSGFRRSTPKPFKTHFSSLEKQKRPPVGNFFKLFSYIRKVPNFPTNKKLFFLGFSGQN
jgi:hypothetical protein